MTGGAGAVGHNAIELTKRAGARVIATTGGQAKSFAARIAGADAVVGRRVPDLAAEIRRANGGQLVDRIVDVAPGANLRVSSTARCH